MVWGGGGGGGGREVVLLLALLGAIACLLYAHTSVSVSLSALDDVRDQVRTAVSADGDANGWQSARGVLPPPAPHKGRKRQHTDRGGGTKAGGGGSVRSGDIHHAVNRPQQYQHYGKGRRRGGGADARVDLAHAAIAGMFWESDDICLHSHKLMPGCPHNGRVPLLVTGVGRSGTHHIASALRMKGLDVCHEAVCSQGSVAWTYAVVDPDGFYPWEAARRRIHGQRFQQIFHIVRHPLRCISSLTTFEGMSWKFIGRHTPQVPGLATLQPVLRRALIHWVTWNRMVEVHADRHFRMEDTMPADICRAAGFEEAVCGKRINRAARAKRTHKTVTWEDLYRVDKEFTRAAMRLAHKYGYDDARHVLTGDDDDADDADARAAAADGGDGA